MSAPHPAPGWYPDPSGGGERWWDGGRWTEHTRHAEPASFGAPSGAPSGTAATAPADGDARQWGAIAHASALVGLVIGISAVGPLIVYLIRKDGDPWVRAQAAEALNFNISWLIWLVGLSLVTFVLFFILIGVLLIPIIALGALAWLVLVVVGAVRAGRGESFRYPLTIRFVS
jgi:uncharacterized protein